MGSGCDSVGRAVASESRGLPFETSHRQTFTSNCIVNCNEKSGNFGSQENYEDILMFAIPSLFLNFSNILREPKF